MAPSTIVWPRDGSLALALSGSLRMVHEPIVNSLVSKRIVDIFPCSWLTSTTRSCCVRCFCKCHDGQSDSITTIRLWCSSFHHSPPDTSMHLRLVTATLSLPHDQSAVGAIHRAPPGSYHRCELTKVKYRESLQKRILEQPRAEVLTLRADCFLAAPKPVHSSCLLPIAKYSDHASGFLPPQVIEANIPAKAEVALNHPLN